MNLRIRFAFWFAVFSALVLSLSFTIIYLQSADFRQEEFKQRLMQRAMTTKRLLIDVSQIDSTLLKIIDRNTLTTLINERVLVFDGKNRLMYHSVDEDSISPLYYTLLNEVKQRRQVYHFDSQTRQETIGLFIEGDSKSFIFMATALDEYGFRKLYNLRNILIITWLIGLGLTVMLAYFYVRNIVGRPLSDLTRQIATIGEEDLTRRIEVPRNQDELTTLAQNFNDLLFKLETAFETQRSFVQYASHELRTPLANMLSETENALSKERSPEIYQNTLLSLREEQSRLVELTNALLQLSQYEKTRLTDTTPLLRIDEVLYQTIEEVRALDAHYRMSLGFEGDLIEEKDLLLQGHEPLLRTAFRNLLENACRYADDQTAAIHIHCNAEHLQVSFENKGKTLSQEDSKLLFVPFFRGNNTSGKRGYGLGLVIAKRIINIHKGLITYNLVKKNHNQFRVIFPKNSI